MSQTTAYSRPPTILRVLKNHPTLQSGKLPTAGELAVAHLQAHLAFHEAHASAAAAPISSSDGPLSLSDLAARKIIAAVSEDITAESLQILLNNCPPKLLAKVLANPTLSYPAFRRLATVCDEEAEKEGIRAAQEVTEIDEWVLGNERAIRRLGVKEQMQMLVDLERDGDVVWPESKVKDGVRTLVRKEPPRETLAVLGEARERRFRILSSTQAFEDRWNRMTGGVLQGLDWSNCFVAGGMALSTLMCVEDQMEERWKDSDIDMYIYGLTPDAANKKVQEIYDVWWRNLGPMKSTFCVKNSKTITFISDYPERRIQIILKYVASPAEVLLNFDLDQCAVGWTGSQVLLLPRCARALETGYSVFTTDLVYGHYLSDRRATQEIRVFKYADRGFGILFPASLLAASEVHFKSRRPHTLPNAYYWRSRQAPPPPLPPATEVVRGKKAVKKIAWSAQDLVQRFFIGRTKGTELTRDELLDDQDIDLDNYDSDNDGPYDNRKMVKIDIQKPDGTTETKRVPLAGYARINGRLQHVGQPGGRFGLKMFETFMRMVELWRLDYHKQIKLVKDSFESLEYADHGYDDIPGGYTWDSTFSSEDLARRIEHFNDLLFESTQDTIGQATNMYPLPSTGWNGYFTRRFRRIITAPTLDALWTKQITLPIWVPQELDDYVTTLTAARFGDGDEHRILIPAFNSSYRGRIPPLPDTSEWKLRIWVIGNTTMWARSQSREVDELFEILWTLYHLAWSSADSPGLLPFELWDLRTLLALFLERRPVPDLPPPGEGEGGEGGGEGERKKWLDEVEKKRWNEWLADRPLKVCRSYTQGFHGLYVEKFGMETPEDWYWDEETDGANDAGRWRSVEEGKAAGETDGETERSRVALKRKREDSGILEGMVAEAEAVKVDQGEETE